MTLSSYITKLANSVTATPSARRSYRALNAHLEAYQRICGTDYTIGQFGETAMQGFIYYLKDKGLRPNTVKNQRQRIGIALTLAKKEGYLIDESYRNVKVRGELGAAVYLSMEEIRRLYSTRMSPVKELVRDIFIISCLTGLRWGDLSKLKTANIQGDFITLRTNKTHSSVIIPQHSIVREIVNKYNGIPRYTKSQQNFGRILKRACRDAGFTSKILIERTEGARLVTRVFYKFELITPHTGRRSFATNAYIAKIPVARIMLMTGHLTESSFFRYIRISKEENARELAEHPFFQ